MTYIDPDGNEWETVVRAAVDLNLGLPPPTLDLFARQELAWAFIDCRLRIRMWRGSMLHSCKFGPGVQVDALVAEGPRPFIEHCAFEGQREGFEYPKPFEGER